MEPMIQVENLCKSFSTKNGTVEAARNRIRIIIICRINGTVRNLSGRSPETGQDPFWHHLHFLQRLL